MTEGKYIVDALRWKGCPFCGKLPEVTHRAASDYEGSKTGEVWFAVCHCKGYSANAWQHGETEDECRKEWNRRAPLGKMPLVSRIGELADEAARTIPSLGTMTVTLTPIQLGWMFGMLQKEYQEAGDGCGACHRCAPNNFITGLNRMILCPDCGNKRCPKANDCQNECTGSNDPGQPGSAYP